MFQIRRILVSTLSLGAVVVGLGACGQQGPLYLPTEPAAANRATLPETLMRSGAQRPAPPVQIAPPENK
jgi:predicted small lipoprotein YifL